MLKVAVSSNLISVQSPICGDYKNTVPKLPVASQERGLQADTCMPVSIWKDILECRRGGLLGAWRLITEGDPLKERNPRIAEAENDSDELCRGG